MSAVATIAYGVPLRNNQIFCDVFSQAATKVTRRGQEVSGGPVPPDMLDNMDMLLEFARMAIEKRFFISQEALELLQGLLRDTQHILENEELCKAMQEEALEKIEYYYHEMCKAVCILQVQNSKKINELLLGRSAS